MGHLPELTSEWNPKECENLCATKLVQTQKVVQKLRELKNTLGNWAVRFLIPYEK